MIDVMVVVDGDDDLAVDFAGIILETIARGLRQFGELLGLTTWAYGSGRSLRRSARSWCPW